MKQEYKTIDFDQIRTIHLIAKRACELAKESDVKIDLITMAMDISGCHETNPLKLDELLKADNGNFGHDVFGIRRHLNRQTGELKDGFSPRYSS